MITSFKFSPISEIDGVFRSQFQHHNDSRGTFQKIFESTAELNSKFDKVLQVNISSNRRSGTIRGLHFQIKPYQEFKLVTCLSGRLFDVLLDLRPDSKTFKSWFSVELVKDGFGLLIPPMVAHGFQTLEDNSDVLYLHSSIYNQEYSRGVNPLDPDLEIEWPKEITEISEHDKSLPKLFELLKI